MPLSEKYIDRITREEVRTLLATSEAPQVSIYLPTHRLWNESPQDPRRLKNLLREVEEKLTEQGMDKNQIKTLLAPAVALLDDDNFWKHGSDGLALFLTPETFRSYRLPISFEERTCVGAHFYIRPMLPVLEKEHTFYVLVLNLEDIALLQCTGYTVNEVELEDVPESLKEAMRFDDFEAVLNFYTGTAARGAIGAPGAVFHGSGDTADEANIKKQILRFFQTVDNGVRAAITPDTDPLVLVGLSHLQGIYRKANHYQHLVEKGVDVNPASLSVKEVHERAWEVVDPIFRESREELLETYQQRVATAPDRVANTAEEAVRAAQYGRVDTLFIPENGQVWGSFEPQANEVHLHDGANSGAEDLLDRAAALTIENNGTVYTLPVEAMPNKVPVAAVLRY